MFKLQDGIVNIGPGRKANGLGIKVNFIHGSHENGAAPAELAKWIDDVEWRIRRSTDLSQHRMEQRCVLVRHQRHAFSRIMQAGGQRPRAVSTGESTTQDYDRKRISLGSDSVRHAGFTL